MIDRRRPDRITTWSTVLALAATLTIATATSAVARPGDLDPTFGGGDGVVTTEDVGGGARGAGTDIAFQSDGKILVVGNKGRTNGNFAVWRLNADGSRDPTFSGDGVAVIDVGGVEEAEELALTAAGRIVVAGTTRDASGNTHVALARLTRTGQLDTSFSGDGLRVRIGPNDSRGYGVALDDAGNIFVAGSRGFRFSIFKFTPSGQLDRSLGGTGAVDVGGLSGNTFSNLPEQVDLLLQPDGRIVALGTHLDARGTSDCGVARLMPDGQPDPSFSEDGIVFARFPDEDSCTGIVRSDVNGALTVAGSLGAGTMTLARFSSAGVLDPTFSGDGRVMTKLGMGFARAWGVGLEGSTTIAVGEVDPGTGSMWAVARFTSAGLLDPTFGDGGRVFVDLNTCCGIEAGTTANIVDGKLVVGGVLGAAGSFAVTRHLAGDTERLM